MDAAATPPEERPLDSSGGRSPFPGQMTLTDLFVAFSLLNTIPGDNAEEDARRAYDRAEALVRERFLRA